MDPTFFQTWVPITLGIINLGGLVWAILQSSAKKNAEAIDKLADALVLTSEKMAGRVQAVEKRTATLEDAFRHVPDKESMHRQELSIEKMAGIMGVMGAEMKAVREITVMTRDMILKDAA